MQDNQDLTISVQGEPKSIPPGTNLSLLLESLKIGDVSGLAIAVNQQVVPRKEWDKFLLKESSDVLLIRATQGG